MEYGKSYTGEVDQYREKIWMNNVKYIEEFNREDHPYKLGINQFTDLTDDEFTHQYTRGIINPT